MSWAIYLTGIDDIAKLINSDQNKYIRLGELLAEIEDSELISLICEIDLIILTVIVKMNSC